MQRSSLKSSSILSICFAFVVLAVLAVFSPSANATTTYDGCLASVTSRSGDINKLKEFIKSSTEKRLTKITALEAEIKKLPADQRDAMQSNLNSDKKKLAGIISSLATSNEPTNLGQNYCKVLYEVQIFTHRANQVEYLLYVDALKRRDTAFRALLNQPDYAQDNSKLADEINNRIGNAKAAMDANIRLENAAVAKILEAKIVNYTSNLVKPNFNGRDMIASYDKAFEVATKASALKKAAPLFGSPTSLTLVSTGFKTGDGKPLESTTWRAFKSAVHVTVIAKVNGSSAHSTKYLERDDYLSPWKSTSAGSPVTPDPEPEAPADTGLICPGNLRALKVSWSTYYQMPTTSKGYYEFNGATPPSQRYGRRDLICAIYTVSKAYETKYGSKSKVRVGDLNASGHSSHRWGIAVDIYAYGSTSAANRTISGYSRDATIEFGKMWVNTGLVKNIWFCDGGDGSSSAIKRYASSKGKSIEMKCLPGHDNHFHVDVTSNKGASHMP